MTAAARLSPESESERASRDCVPPSSPPVRSRGQGGTGILLSPWPNRRAVALFSDVETMQACDIVPKEDEKFSSLSTRNSYQSLLLAMLMSRNYFLL